MNKRISIVTPCYNEVGNVANLQLAVQNVMSELPDYEYEHIFIDNCSEDGTQEVLRELTKQDSRTLVIFNERNFGFSRSSYYGLTQATGDCVIYLMADFQDPPELIPKMIQEWQDGAAIVTCVKSESKESFLMYFIRGIYYKIMKIMTDGEHIEHFTGFGLYDSKFIDLMKEDADPNPYLRGLVAQFGYRIKKIEYQQSIRAAGKSKFRFLGLFDLAMLGLVSSSQAPLRFLVFAGLIASILSFSVGMVYVANKLLFWSTYQEGIAGLAAAIFFLGSIQLLFLGVIGEYVGSTITQVRKRPLVIERERINFADQHGGRSEID
jgi:glycosyltransferase involved in cell wall biosynthesis